MLRKGSAEAFIINVVGFGLTFLMHAVLGRQAGPHEYGLFAHALSIATVLAIVVPVGWPTAIMRLIPQYTAQAEPRLVWGSILRGHQVTFISCCFVCLILWVAGRSGYVSPQLSKSLVSAGFLLPPLAFFLLHQKVFRGLQKIKAGMVPRAILLPLFVIGAALVLSANTAGQFVGLFFAGGLLACLAAAWWLLRSLKQVGLRQMPRFQTGFWMGIALPMAFVGLSRQVINRTDMVMLGIMENMEVVGVYGAASRLAGMSVFVSAAITTIAAPLLSSAYHSKQLGEFRLVLRKSIMWSSMTGVPLLAIMLLWPEMILRCFGDDFTAGGRLLQILALGQFVNAATGPVGIALLMSDREGLVALSNGVAAVVNIFANYLLIAKIGAMGAAIATCSCIALLNLWKLYLCKVKILDHHI